MYACFAAAGIMVQINAATAKLFLFWKSIASSQYAGIRVCEFLSSYASCLNMHKHTKYIWESNGIKVICWDDCYSVLGIFLPTIYDLDRRSCAHKTDWDSHFASSIFNDKIYLGQLILCHAVSHYYHSIYALSSEFQTFSTQFVMYFMANVDVEAYAIWCWWDSMRYSKIVYVHCCCILCSSVRRKTYYFDANVREVGSNASWS